MIDASEFNNIRMSNHFLLVRLMRVTSSSPRIESACAHEARFKCIEVQRS